MTCSRCTNWNLKKTPSYMARAHFAVCNLGPIWSYMPSRGSCRKFREAAADVIAKRAAWLEKTA